MILDGGISYYRKSRQKIDQREEIAKDSREIKDMRGVNKS
jgi:hypothetical protein